MPSLSFQIPGEMLAAMKTRPESEWKALFANLVQNKLQQVIGCTSTEQLLQVQAGAKELQVLEQFFLAELRRK